MNNLKWRKKIQSCFYYKFKNSCCQSREQSFLDRLRPSRVDLDFLDGWMMSLVLALGKHLLLAQLAVHEMLTVPLADSFKELLSISVYSLACR